MHVGEIGRQEVVTLEPDAGVDEIASTMFREKVGSVIVAEGDQLAGIVTLDDLLVHLAGEYRRLSADLEGLTDVIRAESPSE